MGLLGVVTTLAMWNSDEFESHMLHHSNHGVLEAHLRGAEKSGSNPAWGKLVYNICCELFGFKLDNIKNLM